LAEFRVHYEEFRALRVDMAAISVDGPEHSEPLRQLYQIPFPILCDTNAEVAKSWGLFDPLEKGGIGRSAVFVIEPGLRVKYCSVDSTTTRIRAAELLDYVQGSATGAAAAMASAASISAAGTSSPSCCRIWFNWRVNSGFCGSSDTSSL